MVKVRSKKNVKQKAQPIKTLTRKEMRKQKIIQKKENKRLFFSKKSKRDATATECLMMSKKELSKQGNNKITKIPVEMGSGDLSNDEEICSDFSDPDVDKIIAESNIKNKKPLKRIKVQTSQRPDAVESNRKERARQKDLENASRKQRTKQLKLDNDEEDRMIARLEKKLKLNKTKDKKRLVTKMFNDGLDYALEFCLSDDEGKQNKPVQKQKQNDGKDCTDVDDEELDSSFTNNNDSGLDEDHDDMCTREDDEEDVKDEGHLSDDDETESVQEDIYGRKRDRNGAITDLSVTSEQPQKYVPPHQRAALAVAGNQKKRSALLDRLHKNCKGQLNRLSEANLHKIAIAMEQLYMQNSRHDMNDTLSKLLTEALVGRTVSNERMVQEHMVLLAYLHAQVGTEIGAHFLQLFIEDFDRLVRDINTIDIEDKKLNNLVLILSYLYIFKIYEHRLLIEIITRLADNLCEKAIECMLLIFQSVGFKLRKDDPLAFKQMMQSVQKKIAESPMELKENLRLKFMVDILNAVKNNNINKIPQFDPELAESLRKRLKGMLRNDKYVITLNITMGDLLRADQVGKWWIVGSAWSGNIKDLGSASASAANQTHSTAQLQRFSEKLLTLAKQQKMNTDDRRNIFCIIMSADDYVNAFEKILHLSLKDQRTVACVILHCALNEARPNPYYAHLAQKFCTYDRKFQLAFQFATWDRVNEIDSLTKQQIRNLSKFLLHLILQGGLVLSVLKVVDFVQLDKLSFLLMKEIILGLLLDADENDSRQAFERVAKNPKLGTFKNSIRLFMQHFLLKNNGSSLKLNNEQMELLKRRVDYVDNLLTYVDL